VDEAVLLHPLGGGLVDPLEALAPPDVDGAAPHPPLSGGGGAGHGRPPPGVPAPGGAGQSFANGGLAPERRRGVLGRPPAPTGGRRAASAGSARPGWTTAASRGPARTGGRPRGSPRRTCPCRSRG